MQAFDKAIDTGRWSLERRRLRLYTLCLLLDLALISVGFSLASEVRGANGLSVYDVPLLFGALVCYPAFAIVCEAYSVVCLLSLSESARRTLAAFGATSLLIVTFAFFAQVGSVISRLAFAYAIFLSMALLVVGRVGIAALVRWTFKGIVTRNLLIVEDDAPHGYAHCDILRANDIDLFPNLDDPTRVANISSVVAPYDKVYLSAAEARREPWITALKATGISVELVVPIEAIYGAVDLGQLGQSDTLILSRGPLSLSSRIKKRAFDLVLTIPTLILIAPLLIAVAVAIRLDSKGPALFAQNRIGLGNQTFKIFKFRSMRLEQSDADGVTSTQRGDERITRVGRFIRATSIDELPQLFNVLIGNMSLVGPRPHAFASTAEDRLFWQISQRYWMRHASKPGITGLAQIRGFRGSTERAEDLEARLRSDLEYLQTWSFWRDLVILFATVRVIRHDNAF
jgi:exopolysaccharide biosynthesis polyprenyl glycosylphosphotransferase